MTILKTLQDLELERDYDIRKFIKKNMDLVLPATIYYVILMAYYENVLAILILPLGYLIINSIHKKINARNMKKLDYMIDQNAYFEDVTKQANILMDLMADAKKNEVKELE